MAGPGVHSEWLLENVFVSNILRTTSKHVGRNQCKEWALKHLKLLLTPQGEAPRAGAKLIVD